MIADVWFWQRIVTPHMAGLAAAFAERGVSAVYVAQDGMSPERAAQGWTMPPLGNAALKFAPSESDIAQLIESASPESIHICQGFRGNGLISVASRLIEKRGLRQLIVMEKIDDNGWRGLLRRLVYAVTVRSRRAALQGVLAIGKETDEWLIDRGMPREKVFPFSYFLGPEQTHAISITGAAAFRILFVGQFIERKRLDLLIEALSHVADLQFEFVVVGTGPLEDQLRQKANNLLPGKVEWLGRQPMEAISALMATCDLLVLPSRHDGWGAVVSEALMAGTPAICSDACGAAVAVEASGRGGVFKSGDRSALMALLISAIDQGKVLPEERRSLARWSQCLGAASGAAYLERILSHTTEGATRPVPPWATPVLPNVPDGGGLSGKDNGAAAGRWEQ
jgi:glycosyltransferase involved in cell wall biosynthesis